MKSKQYYEALTKGIMDMYGEKLGFSENMKLGIARYQYGEKSNKEFPLNLLSKINAGESGKYEHIRVNNVDELWIYYFIVFQSWMDYRCPDIISHEERMGIYNGLRHRYLQWKTDRVLDDILDMGIDEFLEKEQEKREKRSELARKNKNKHLRLMQGYENPHITKERRNVEKTIAKLKKDGTWYRK